MKIREEINCKPNDILLISVGEINANKNHEVVVKALYEMHMSNIHYIIAGTGQDSSKLQSLINDLNLGKQVHLLGYRNDIKDLLNASDVFVFPSFREGLSLALMEAMCCSKPVVCSRIRGNIDLIDDKGGELFDPDDVNSCEEALYKIFDKDLLELGNYNKKKIAFFSLDNVLDRMESLYIFKYK